MPTFDLNNYIPVQERINAFHEKYPEGRILTALASDPDNWTQCRYRAEVYISLTDERPVATGYAFEIAGKGMANQTSHEENCETSAIGRALANLGFATSHAERPSREEMQKVERMHEELAAMRDGSPAQPRTPPPSRISSIRVRPRQEETGEGHSGLYYIHEGQEYKAPNVAQPSTKVDQVNALVRANGFTGGATKGEIIKELEQTYKITVMSGRGLNRYNEPDVLPFEIYDLAHHLIEQAQHEAAAPE
jgi:hypothetical protein